jgi:hypothetical protein
MIRILLACIWFASIGCGDDAANVPDAGAPDASAPSYDASVPRGDFALCVYAVFPDAGPGGCYPAGGMCQLGEYAVSCGSVAISPTGMLPAGCNGGGNPGGFIDGCCPCQ